MLVAAIKYFLNSRVCDVYADFAEYKSLFAECRQRKNVCKYYKKLMDNGAGCICKNRVLKNTSYYNIADAWVYRIVQPCKTVLNGGNCIGVGCDGYAINQKYITACEDYRIMQNKKKKFWMNKIQCNR